MTNATVRSGPPPMPQPCRCGHHERKHTLPGFDGECVACTCLTFRPVERVAVPHRVPVRLSAGERHLVAVSWQDTLIAEIDAGPGTGGGHDHSKARP